MQKILIIGGFGFIGRHIAAELISQEFSVGICDINPRIPKLPDSIKIIQHNFNTATDEVSISILKSYDAVIFCGGRDDRTMPDKDAYTFFYEENVKTSVHLTKLASEARVKKLIILGSYFAYFNRAMPQLKLAEHHPYIRSRAEQETESINAAFNDLQVIVLEIPYVFGTLEGVVPLWKKLVRYINSTPFVFYTQGGTNFISVKNLAQAVAGAVKFASHKDCIPVAGKNMTWNEMIQLIAKSLNKKRVVISLPYWFLKPLTYLAKLYFKIRNIQSGLDPYYFIKVQSIKTYLDVEYSSSYLGYKPETLDKVFAETVEVCMRK